ncbi:Rho guanine nucleotide exchange factor [Lithohypha guttulata]|nr:Rho guanine nucleotide exchange factor [Lithohypha guttulata]
MSNYPNGQQYYQAGGQHHSNSYTISNSGYQGLNHRSSFNAGEDDNTFASGQTQNQSQYYGHGQSPQGQSQPYGTPAALPYRTQSHLGGYQHQSHSASSAHPSYNPAQYQPQSAYNPQTYTSQASNSYGSAGYQSGFQPYVPAAYGDPALNQNASTYANPYRMSSQLNYNSVPPVPPRMNNSQSPGQMYPADMSNTLPYQSNQHLQMPSPPAPPPHQDSTRPYFHSTNSYDQFADPFIPSSQVARNHSSASRTSDLSHPYSHSPQLSADPPSRNPSQTGNSYGGRHPQGSTLPGLPSESESDQERYGVSSGTVTEYDDLMNTLDAAIGTSSQHHTGYSITAHDPLFSPASPQLALSPDERPTHNGIITTGEHNINYGAFANDSDAEAAAGLAAMQAADEQEAAEEARRYSSGFQVIGAADYSDKERSDDSDYATGYGDLSLAGGGYAGTMHYGSNLPAVTASSHGYEHQLNPRMGSMRSSGVSSTQSSGYEHLDTAPLFPTLQPGTVRVDTEGTGGLTEPSPHPRRLSYEDGDEGGLSDYAEREDGIPDLFFHPGMSPNRPLPPPPARSTSDAGSRSSQHLSVNLSVGTDNRSSYHGADASLRLYPTAPDAYNNDALSPSVVPRSTSLASNRSQPRYEQPMRSKTDADRARILKQQAVARGYHDSYSSTTPKSDASVGALDLPAIPRKKFDPSKISTATYDRCTEPWAMSSVFAWIKSLADEENDLKEGTLVEAISALYCHKVPTISSIDAEDLAQQFVQDMYSSAVLHKDEEWVKFSPGSMSGVMYQLTGLGCYSSLLHISDGIKGRCYSHHCMRTVKKADFSIPDSVKEIDWKTYWKTTTAQEESRDKKEIARQYNMREIVYSEDGFLYGLNVLRTLYRDRLARADVTVIPPKRLPSFIHDVFGLADNVRKVNEEYLAPQLKYRENEQGPFVVGHSDILREWIRRARPIYVDFASRYPKADAMVRDELQRNPAFATFLDNARKEPISNRLGWDNYLKSPIQRLQRLILQLETLSKNSTEASDEKTNLAYAIDEVKACAHEMDVRVAEVNKTLDLVVLSKKLRFTKHPGDQVDLALDHLGRTIVLRGDMMRQGGKGVFWVPCQAILFDHFLVLSKPSKDVHGNEVYDVSKPPIPMGLISLESISEPAVMRSSVRGVTTVPGQGSSSKGVDPRLARTTSSQSGSVVQHTNTGLTTGSGASGSIAAATNNDADSKDDKIYYPFKVKHLGRTEVYTLYVTTAEKRSEWCEAIMSAKTQHAQALHAQNAEPFDLRVLADTAFGAEPFNYGPKRLVVRGTPLDRAIADVEKKYHGSGRPAPICRTAVNCSTVFQQPPGRLMCAIGTDSGVYISEYQNPRGWIRAIQMTKVTQIAVLEEFNLLILLSDKVLIAYHLDVVCPPSGPPLPQTDASVRKAPQKLSGSKDVGFFLAGKMKDRVLVFYQKRDGINSIFKILEPVLQRAATSRSRWLGNSSRRGSTEFFREYDEFYIPAETYGLNMFQSSLAVATKRGMEVLTLDKKITWGVPNLESQSKETKPHLDLIGARLKDLRPLGMFRLSEAEFIVAFSECAVYVNKLGDVSRSVTMEFVGRANTACLFYPYLILFNDEFVEIRDAQSGRLKQVVTGQNIKMLDDGGNATPGVAGGPASLGGGINGLGVQGLGAAARTVKMSMLHPGYERSYVVVELLLKTDQQH